MNERTRLEVPGQSLDGRDIDLLIVGMLQPIHSGVLLGLDSTHYCGTPLLLYDRRNMEGSKPDTNHYVGE